MDNAWYYVVNGKDKAGPVSELALKSLIQQGQVAPTSLVWSEGMTDWQQANQVPGLIGMGPSVAKSARTAAAAQPNTAPSPSSTASSYSTNDDVTGPRIPQGLIGWTKFIGVLSILHGILTCLGCLTIPIGVLMIIAGNAALTSCKSLESMTTIDTATAAYLQNMKRFMLMWGIVAIIGVFVTIISIPLYFAMVLELMGEFQNF